MSIHINNECEICGHKFTHDPYQPQVCGDCLKEYREIEEYMTETGDWKGVMKRIKAMEAKFLLDNDRIPKRRMAAVSCSELIDFLIEETFDEAVFSMISAITGFGIENRCDAATAIGRDPKARHWAEMTALALPEPYQQNAGSEV